MGHRKTNSITRKFTSFLKDAVKAPPVPPPEPESEEPEMPPMTTPESEWEETATEEEPAHAQSDAPAVLDELNSATQRWKETGDPGLHLEAPIPLSERAKQVWNKLAHDVSPKVAHALKNKIELVAQTANTKLHQMHKPQFPIIQADQPVQVNSQTSPAPPMPPAPQKQSETTRIMPAVKTPATPPQPTPIAATPVSPEQIDNAIIASWMEVLSKAEEKAPPGEREEIEKLYKQLSQ